MATNAAGIAGDVKDLALSGQGCMRIEWAANSMPVLKIIREDFRERQPLKGIRIAACLHVTTKRPTWPSLSKKVAPRWSCALRTRFPRRMTSPRPWSANTAFPPSLSKVSPTTFYYNHILAAIDHKPNITNG